ncbi:MAG: hypothetical protein H0W76_13675 [Pyrinomonadaceae bacterium]|nr:hypothetical protein [Pyrinomonadaceae bacterium]
MRQVKTIALIVLLLGLLYVAGAAFCLHQYQGVTKLFEHYGIQYSEQLKIDMIVKMRQTLRGGFVLFTVAALLTLIAASGLFCAKEWARKFRLGVVLLLAIFHMARLATDLREGKFILAMRVAEVVLIVLIAAVSWRQLTKESMKNLFRRSVVSDT